MNTNRAKRRAIQRQARKGVVFHDEVATLDEIDDEVAIEWARDAAAAELRDLVILVLPLEEGPFKVMLATRTVAVRRLREMAANYGKSLDLSPLEAETPPNSVRIAIIDRDNPCVGRSYLLEYT